MIINWGDAPFKAFITVTYPRGTCAVTGEGQTFTHTGGGTVTFTVKKKGTYTVSGTASDGGSGNETAKITKSGQAVSVKLIYRFYIFQEGKGAVNGFSFTNYNTYAGFGVYSSKIIYCNNHAFTSAFYANPAKDLTAFTKLHFELKVSVLYDQNRYIRIGVGSTPSGDHLSINQGWWAVQSGNITSATRTVYTLDISSVNSSQYIKLFNNATQGEIYNIWLE